MNNLYTNVGAQQNITITKPVVTQQVTQQEVHYQAGGQFPLQQQGSQVYMQGGQQTTGYMQTGQVIQQQPYVQQQTIVTETQGVPVYSQGGQMNVGATSLQKGYDVSTTTTSSFNSTTVAPTVQRLVRPAIVQETVRIDTVTEVQPIIHREIEETQIKVIEKHTYETVRSVGPSTYTNQAIIEETVRPTIREEIQPVLHRNVPSTYVEKVEEHITEHVVQPTVTTKQVTNESRNMGFEEATALGLVAAIPEDTSMRAPVVTSRTAAAVTETHARGAIVEESVRREKILEVQPIIHREIEAPEVHVIEKHSYETVASTGPRTITNEAIVQETIHPVLIEEVQPVVHRQVGQVVVEKVEQHLNERVVAPTTTTKEVTSETVVGQEMMRPVQQQRGEVVVNSRTAAAVTESRTRDMLVEETVRTEKIVEVQPIIHREIDAPEVRVIEKHMYETVPSNNPSVVTKQAIVEETVRPTVHEEIQSVVHRSVPVTFVERVEQHSSERVVQPTINTKQVVMEEQHRVIQQPTASSTTTTTTTTSASVPLVGQQQTTMRTSTAGRLL